MARTISISFHGKLDITHRLRNFAEELRLALERRELGVLPMEEADRAEKSLLISAIPARKLRRVTALVESMVHEQMLHDPATVSAAAPERGATR